MVEEEEQEKRKRAWENESEVEAEVVSSTPFSLSSFPPPSVLSLFLLEPPSPPSREYIYWLHSPTLVSRRRPCMVCMQSERKRSVRRCSFPRREGGNLFLQHISRLLENRCAIFSAGAQGSGRAMEAQCTVHGYRNMNTCKKRKFARRINRK